MWNSESFTEEVRRQAPPEISPYVVKNAIEHYVECRMVGESEVHECIALARRMQKMSQVSALEENEEPEGPSSFALNELEVVLASEQLLEQWRPQVNKLREELFGSPEAPFPNYEDAVAWLEGEFIAGKPDPSSNKDTFFEELDELIEKWLPVLEYPMKVQPERLGLTHFNPETGRVYKRPYWNQSKLPRLHAFVESASRHTGFSEHSLIAHVLTGVVPSSGHIAIGTRRFFSGRSPEITITIRKPTICWADLRQAYQMIQQERGKKRPDVLRPKDRDIVVAMRELGPLPPKGQGRMQYWEDVRDVLTASWDEVGGPGAIRVRVYRKNLLEYV